MTEYVSRELFHFVGNKHPDNDETNFDILRKILTAKVVSHPPHERNWGTHAFEYDYDGSLTNETFISPTITCYADIPFRSLAIHITKYGKFGLSLDREYLASSGARPVTYIPMNAGDSLPCVHGKLLLRTFETATIGFKKFIEDAQAEETTTVSMGKIPEDVGEAVAALDSLLHRDFLAFLKPYNALLPEEHPRNYYMEREWRKLGNIVFEPMHVRTIIAPSTFVEPLLEEFPAYQGRVQAVEDIVSDGARP